MFLNDFSDLVVIYRALLQYLLRHDLNNQLRAALYLKQSLFARDLPASNQYVLALLEIDLKQLQYVLLVLEHHQGRILFVISYDIQLMLLDGSSFDMPLIATHVHRSKILAMLLLFLSQLLLYQRRVHLE